MGISLNSSGGLRFCLLTALLAMVCLGGCGSRKLATYPVSGKVTFENGAPLSTGGIIMFQSVAAKDQPVSTAAGTIEADGTFKLSTFTDGDGAPAGKYRALVMPKRDAGNAGQFGRTPAPPLDPRFQSYDTSGLTFTVEQGNNELKVVLKRS
jgi:hypothetical protein